MNNCTKPCKHDPQLDNIPGRLTIGEFQLGRYAHGGFWLNRPDGEGMQIKEETLIALIDKFWKDHF